MCFVFFFNFTGEIEEVIHWEDNHCRNSKQGTDADCNIALAHWCHDEVNTAIHSGKARSTNCGQGRFCLRHPWFNKVLWHKIRTLPGHVNTRTCTWRPEERREGAEKRVGWGGGGGGGGGHARELLQRNEWMEILCPDKKCLSWGNFLFGN